MYSVSKGKSSGFHFILIKKTDKNFMPIENSVAMENTVEKTIYFSADISVPPHKNFIGAIAVFVRNCAAAAGVPASATNCLELAAEEIAVMIIEKFPLAEHSAVAAKFTAYFDAVQLAFVNQGLPMTAEHTAEFELNRKIIYGVMDTCEFLNLGNDGWKIVAEKKVPLNTQLFAPPETSVEAHKQNVSRRDKTKVQIVRATPEMAEQITNLTYLTYRYSESEDFFYYPEKLAAMLAHEEIISFVGVTDSGEVVAHGAAIFEGEMLVYGGLMIAPSFRHGRIMLDLQRVADEFMTRVYGEKWGISAYAVTGHAVSQHVLDRVNLKPTGLTFSAEERFNFVGMQAIPPQRESYLICARGAAREFTLWIPQTVATIAEKIFATLGDKPSFHFAETANNDVCLPEKTEFTDNFAEVFRQKTHVVPGRDFAAAMGAHIFAPNDNLIKTATFFIPTWLPLPSDFAEVMRKNRLFFSGFLPVAANQWEMIYTCIYRQKFDFSEVKTYHPLAKELVEFAESEYTRIALG